MVAMALGLSVLRQPALKPTLRNFRATHRRGVSSWLGFLPYSQV